ncbi:helix-turn-helix domain-containing protein [Bombilactobacillus bombi]|uniref:helix-turn-helix domain-containing protein n=1 Tax=Bombilactobacillus bombi TaxID=1303590 RepID=UPI000E580B65|nr:helix-turn-helix domain-containing protein [Bombilactobacillus bombi]AXX64824.1 helix-turn-helix domain-containing protein [Bombilactobacillus bombi]
MGEIGEKLRSARLERGYTIDDLQKKTKIQKRYLVAIEEEKFDQLPGDFYVRAFVKQYAESVGLDSKALLQEFGDEIPQVQPEEVQPETPKPKKETLWNSIRNHLPQISILAVVVVIVCLIGLVMAKVHSQNAHQIPKTTQVETKKPTTHKSTKAKKKADTTKKAPASEQQLKIKADNKQTDGFVVTNWQSASAHNLRLTATNADAWITVNTGDEGQTLWQGVVNAGSSHDVDLQADVQKISIKTGNAASTEIYLNDVQLPVSEHQVGTVHTYTLSIKE